MNNAKPDKNRVRHQVNPTKDQLNYWKKEAKKVSLSVSLWVCETLDKLRK